MGHRPEPKEHASLSDREQFALVAYIALKSHTSSLRETDKIQINTYRFTHDVDDELTDKEIHEDVEDFFHREDVLKFLDAKTPIYGVIHRGQRTMDANADISANEELIRELENLKNTSEDPDTKIKCIREQVNIRHKNKEQFRESHKITRLYAPIRCDECPIYREAKIRYETNKRKP